MNLSSKGILYVDSDDFEKIQGCIEDGMTITDSFEIELDEQKIPIKGIEAIHFNTNYFYLSGQLIFALGKLRLKHRIYPV